ncbi:MAG: hypothetical protein WB511_05250 [Nitrososphaeraceae archaeon]|jgi:hypothetical protein
MIPSVESVGSYDKNDFIDKRHFLVCDCCYWCSSYLPDLENENDEYIDNCPMCNEKIKTMFISEDKSQKLDAKHIQNIMTESENWVI